MVLGLGTKGLAVTPHAQDTGTWITWLSAVCPDMKLYMDIGAGDGYDCGLIKIAFPTCRCIAIEPYETKECPPEVEWYTDLIGAKDDWTCFHATAKRGINSMYPRVSLESEEVLAMPVRTLAHFCKREMIAKIDAMKIDVEGAAWDVIVGADMAVMEKVRAIHVETEWLPLFRGQTLEPEVFAALKAFGLTMVWTNRVEGLGQGDSIWVRQ